MTSAEAAAPVYSTTFRRAATLTGLMAAFTMVLTGTIVNVAVPDVMGAFGVGQDTAQFMSTAYIATMTASQLLAAWFIAVFGRRASFSTLIIVFILGGVLCAVSPNIELIIVGRLIQGFCSGIVQPLIMTMIVSLAPPERRGQAVGVYVGGLALALGFGPVVGGITVDTLSWKWIFLVPLPVVSVALVLGTFFVPEESGPRRRMSFDWWGYGLLCVALYCLMSGLAGGGRLGWDADIIIAYWFVGGFATLAFITSQRGANARLLDLALFADPRFAAAIALVVVFGVANFALTYSIPVFGQLVLNLTPTAAGLLLLPAGLAGSVLTLLVGRLSDTVSPLVLILLGLTMLATGCWWLAQGDANTPFLSLMLFAVLTRAGTSFVGPAITATAIRALPPAELNKASGTINFFRQMGGAFGINALVALVGWRTEVHHESLAATQHGGNQSTTVFVDGVARMLDSTGLGEALLEQLAWRFLDATVTAQSAALAWREGFLALVAVTLFAIVPTWMLGRAQRRR